MFVESRDWLRHDRFSEVFEILLPLAPPLGAKNLEYEGGLVSDKSQHELSVPAAHGRAQNHPDEGLASEHRVLPDACAWSCYAIR